MCIEQEKFMVQEREMVDKVTSIFSNGTKDMREMNLKNKMKLALIIVGFLGLTIGLSFCL